MKHKTAIGGDLRPSDVLIATAVVPADHTRPSRQFPVTFPYKRWGLATSVLAHALVLTAISLFMVVQPIDAPPVHSIAIEIVPSKLAQLSSSSTPISKILITPPSPPRAPVISAPKGAGGGMIHPSHLLSKSYIREPASLEIRQNLPKLAPSERMTQLCNIEAGLQIQAANPKIFVDTVHASALGDTELDKLTVTAPKAAYRSDRKWYGVSFTCVVAPNFKSVTDFKFKVGPAIPHRLWSAHNLNAEDDEE